MWGKVGKYQIFFVTLQRNSKKGEIYTNDNIDNLRGNQKHPKKRAFSGTPQHPAALKESQVSVNWYINKKIVPLIKRTIFCYGLVVGDLIKTKNLLVEVIVFF